MFHLKHLEQTEKSSIFVSYYNIGISYRLLGNIEKSLEFFKKAFEQSKVIKEADSECFSVGQIAVALFLNNKATESVSCFESCLKSAQLFKNFRVELDVLLCLGLIYFDHMNFKACRDSFARG